MDHPRYHGRTVEWGHWGITFSDAQPDRTKNFAVVVGRVHFPIGTRGPFEGDKTKWAAMCTAWIDRREVPEGFVPEGAARMVYDREGTERLASELRGAKPVDMSKYFDCA